MQFGVLGSLAVWSEEEEVLLGGAKQRALLAALLLRSNEVVPTAQLLDDVWGERAPASAFKGIQGYVSELRGLLGSGVIATRPAGYVLQVEPGALDARRFEELGEQGRRLLADGANEDAAEVLREALALWRGPALADFRAEPFARNAIRRLEELRLATLELRLEADLALGRATEAASELEALVAAHPRRENLRELLMLALYRAGRQADALAAYWDARTALVDELGLEPSRSLRRLEQAILRRDPSLDLASPGLAAAVSPASGEILVASRRTVTVLAGGLGGDSRCLEVALAAIELHGGALEMLAGDELVAVFGAHVAREDDALRAVRAALAITTELAELGVQARIGIDSGEVLVGAKTPGDGLVTGSPVAVGKRLEEAAAPGEVLIGGLTHVLVRDAVALEPRAANGAGDPAASYRVVGLREVSERPHRLPFVGRGNELSLVAGLWERVQAERRCELVTIVGEAGVGKSRLAAELLSSSEARVVRGRCLPYGEGITYWPVVEVLKQLDVRPADEAAAAPIRSLLVENDRVARAEDIAWAFRKTLEQAARKRPLVVFLDDIHWGEEAFLDLLEQTALLSSGTPALLLCLARPELVERRPTWPVTLRLEPLGDSEVEQLIPERISGALRAKIVRAAGGNPLYIDEMLTMAEGSDDDVAVPPTLHALLAARLDQLDPGERTVLERAAVEGETFHWGAVRELAPDDAGVASSLASLVRKGLIRPDRALLLGEDAFRFTHLLIRDAAYDRILKETRARLHERFAVWLEEHGAELVTLDELLGYHLEQAHGYLAELGTTGEAAEALAARAARHLGAAGRLAVDRGDVHAAANLLRRATALLPPDDLDRLRLLPVHGYALKDLGRTPEAWVVYDELDERATALGERGLATRGRLGRVVFNTPGTAAWEAGEQLMETFTELGDEAGLAEACRGLATVCRTRGRAAEAAEWNERALAHADACGDRVVHRVATQGISMALCWGPVPAKQAIARCEELRETNRDDRVLDAVLARHLSSLYAMAGRYDDARTCWERGSLVLDEANILSSSWVSLLHSAGAKELAGDRAGAKHDLQSMWLHTRDAMGGAPDMRAMTAAYLLANLYCDDGRWDEAEECLAFHGDASVLEDAPPGAYRFAGAARIAAHRGELAAASTLARTAVEIAAGTDMLNLQARTWLAQAEVHSAAGEAGLAEAAVATALELYERKGNLSAARRVRTSS